MSDFFTNPDWDEVLMHSLTKHRNSEVDSGSLYNTYHKKSVLITGGGGSIGSAICKELCKYTPKEIIILDIYENKAYELYLELIEKNNGKINIVLEIASIRDSRKMDYIFSKYKPNIIFHTAAHKHLPIMENCPDEAVKNNIFGTYNLIKSTEKAKCQSFVFISTDKAVHPTSIMGATKAFCEMIIESKKDCNYTKFSAVRFGNVLGSSGSVLPIFRKKIESKQDICITDFNAKRYFMTTKAAANLVLSSVPLSSGGDILILDMGEPISIVKLAENTVKAYGLTPYCDIKIREIGLRNGEKVSEELIKPHKIIDKTKNLSIYIEKPIEIDYNYIVRCIEEMEHYIELNDLSMVRKSLFKFVSDNINV